MRILRCCAQLIRENAYPTFCYTTNCHSQAAIVLGAALRGLEGVAPTVRFARRHYGYRVGRRFREGTDPEEHAFLDPFDNSKVCAGRVQWMVSKVSQPLTFLLYSLQTSNRTDIDMYRAAK